MAFTETMASSSRITCSGSIGRIIQALALSGARAPMNTVSPTRPACTMVCTTPAWSASAITNWQSASESVCSYDGVRFAASRK